MKLGFVSCVQLGLSCMEALYEAGGALDLVVTLHDDKAVNKSGRVYVDDFCNKHSIPVLKTNHVNDNAVVEAAKSLDWLFIIGWSQIASTELLSAPRKGVLGMHPTLLPEGRGRAAIPWAILKRLERTGVTLFKLDEGVDTGPVLDQFVIDLKSNINASELYGLVDEAHVKLMKKFIPNLLAGRIEEREQDEDSSSIWPGRKPGDGEINLSGSVFDAECLVRAVTTPYPGAFFYQDGRKITVWSAEVVPQKVSNLDGKYLEFSDGFLRCIDYQIGG